MIVHPDTNMFRQMLSISIDGLGNDPQFEGIPLADIYCTKFRYQFLGNFTFTFP